MENSRRCGRETTILTPPCTPGNCSRSGGDLNATTLDLTFATPQRKGQPCRRQAGAAAGNKPLLSAVEGQPPGPTEVAAVGAGLALDMDGQVPGPTLAAACGECRSTDVLGLPACHGADGTVDTSEG